MARSTAAKICNEACYIDCIIINILPLWDIGLTSLSVYVRDHDGDNLFDYQNSIVEKNYVWFRQQCSSRLELRYNSQDLGRLVIVFFLSAGKIFNFSPRLYCLYRFFMARKGEFSISEPSTNGYFNETSCSRNEMSKSKISLLDELL